MAMTAAAPPEKPPEPKPGPGLNAAGAPSAPMSSDPKTYSPFDKLEQHLVPGDIANADPAYQYIYTPARDYVAAPAALVDWRLKMRARGFVPRNGPEYSGTPCPEYHSSEPSAEIWRRPKGLRDDEWRASFAALCLDNRHFASYHLRHPGAEAWIPKSLRDALYQRHGLVGDGKPEVNTPELRARIIALCRRMKVHPGPANED